MDKHLKCLLGVICIADDIIVHGKTEQEHNDCMYALFNRLLKLTCNWILKRLFSVAPIHHFLG